MAQRVVNDVDGYTVRLEASSGGVSGVSVTLVDDAGGVHTHHLQLDTLTATQRNQLATIAAALRTRARLAGGWT